MKTIATKTLKSGSVVSVLEVQGSGGGRKWGIFKHLRVVRLVPGTIYKNIRTPGVSLIESFEFDARSKTQTDAVKTKALNVFNTYAAQFSI
ncbi:MAG: hypothetical protein Q7K57_52315 [Burkholderiaceae bacterium]|nr:hypothetical protein [Burkholderiaceae bacterium]